jgi:hypothetical protein
MQMALELELKIKLGMIWTKKDASHTNYERQCTFPGPNVKGAVFILYNHKITQ